MLKVLAVIGIVLGSLLLLALIILNIFLFVPFRYKIGGSNKDKLYFYFLTSFFFLFFRLKIYYKDEMGYVAIRLFGIKIKRATKKQKRLRKPMMLRLKQTQFPRPIPKNIP